MESLVTLAQQTGATRLYYHSVPEPTQVALEQRITARLSALGIAVHRFRAALLHDPERLRSGSGTPYRVFTAFWTACRQLPSPGRPLPAPRQVQPLPSVLDTASISSLDLLPRTRWDGGLADTWQPGEPQALRLLNTFAASTVAGYPDTRDTPAAAGTSRLSAALHFGEITPRQAFECVQTSDATPSGAAQSYLRQLGWREFAHYLLHHFPHTPDQPLNPRFRHFPWRKRHDDLLNAWQRGATGIPLVDAGMRELWQTGGMHNRLRMVTASFLTKNLRIPWQAGARWFWDTLVDADLANNTLGWQWVAGCGADAAPYFRIFNPVLQGMKFDAEGRYVRHWVPELAALPDRWLHRPWKASQRVLESAGVTLGSDYPRPVVDLAVTRREALMAYDRIRQPPVQRT